MKLRYATVCSGIDAPAVAWNKLGWQQIFSSEIEPFPCAVLKHHNSKVPNYGDMTKYEKWPKHKLDVIIGGTPCQSFSIAGLRKGLADPRGNLALTFLAIVERYAPTWVIWENVPGVFSSWSDVAHRKESQGTQEAGRMAFELATDLGFDAETAGEFGAFEEVDQSNDLDCFLSGFRELGYGLALASLDAQYFGVAQRRERVFVVGHIGGQWQRAAAVLFDRESVCGNPAPSRETGQSAAARASGGVGSSRETAPTISARPTVSGGLGKDFDCDWGRISTAIGEGFCADVATVDAKNNFDRGDSQHLDRLIASTVQQPIGIDGGVNTTMVATTLRACSSTEKGHSARAGDKDENLVVVHSLVADGFDASEDGTGRGTPLVSVAAPICHNGKAAGSATQQDAESGMLVPEVLAHGQAGAEHVRDGSPSLTCNHEAPIGFIPPSGEAPLGEGIPHNDRHASGMAVRRLTPRECERLQGFPDDYTLIEHRGKPAADGPRYKALGNSMATPVVEWIGKRIEQVLKLK